MASIDVAVGTSRAKDTRKAVDEAVARARAFGFEGVPTAAVLAATVEHPAEAAFAALRAALPGVPVHGTTTSLGVLGADGVTTGPDGAVGVMLLRTHGPAAVAVGAAPIATDVRAAGRAAARALREKVHGMEPRALFLGASPGAEEDLLDGIGDDLPGTPLYGGSAADNAIAGDWFVFTADGPQKSAVSLLGFFGDVRAGGAIVAPYTPTAKRATVTGCKDRELETLDGRPAADVLGGWLDGAIDFQVEEGGNILAQTALRPIGVRREGSKGEHYVTIHPAQVKRPEGKLDLFARTRPGDVVCSMEGSVNGLIEAVPRAIEAALADGGFARGDVRGALLIFCAGCAGAVGDRLDAGLRAHISRLLPGVPVLGFCTFGEQGHVPGVGNVHQDLSISALLFG